MAAPREGGTHCLGSLTQRRQLGAALAITLSSKRSFLQSSTTTMLQST